MLAISHRFFSRLNETGIRYCHWKSNIRLDRSLDGKTDLDLLVHPADRDRFLEALETFGFRKVLSHPSRRIGGVEDYLGFDYETGRMIHLHVHYELVLGQRYVKNHRLPIEEFLFGNLSTIGLVPVPRPELELVLLALRAHLKLEGQDLLKHFIARRIGRRHSPFPEDIVGELEQLLSVSDPDVVERILSASPVPLPADSIREFLASLPRNELTTWKLLRGRSRIFESLAPYRKERGFPVFRKTWALRIRNTRAASRLLGRRKKTLPHGGRIFSIVGADGSGKSTVSEDLGKWIGWKLELTRQYYGIPKTTRVRTIDLAVRALRKLGLQKAAESVRALLHAYVARCRYRVHVRSREEADAGRIVLTDRFPLAEFRSMEEPMDGPRLSARAHPFLASVEAEYYRRIEPPDHVFVLQASLETLRGRKSDLPLEVHRRKADAVNSIRPSNGITTIDANRPYPEVLLDIQRRIWDRV